ncbi:hypothetical protein INN71_09730 [Nocardioides sp. ChNu-153]|uniref:hypothetical protein n=1 Tax=unclassified Nocardioides TaxID=2615069 RepID=UPI002407439E|nr:MULTISPECIES: hypothetical protein [unclassified Nocardioides]MDF9715686.1 hypothetical protein [Nocardioides sp. ChNu-99]MDN7121669.1 hypothetical protein [Nocardioides sp. ChNu-153]
MSDQSAHVTRLIWATRGRSWVFRFLLDAGLSDPLPMYERTFGALRDQSEAWRREGTNVALRFPDPEGRADTAGRVIPHEFIVLGPLARQIESVEDGREQLWPVVSAAYAAVWDSPSPPSAMYLDHADGMQVRSR